MVKNNWKYLCYFLTYAPWPPLCTVDFTPQGLAQDGAAVVVGIAQGKLRISHWSSTWYFFSHSCENVRKTWTLSLPSHHPILPRSSSRPSVGIFISTRGTWGGARDTQRFADKMLVGQSEISKDELHVNFVFRVVSVFTKKEKIFLSHLIFMAFLLGTKKQANKQTKSPTICITLKSFLSAFTHIFKFNLRMDKIFFPF